MSYCGLLGGGWMGGEIRGGWVGGLLPVGKAEDGLAYRPQQQGGL